MTGTLCLNCGGKLIKYYGKWIHVDKDRTDIPTPNSSDNECKCVKCPVCSSLNWTNMKFGHEHICLDCTQVWGFRDI